MPTEVIEGFRLSPQQKQLWLTQAAGQGQAYRAQADLHIEGALKPALLIAALKQVFNRHEILRTTFHHPPHLTVPLQMISPPAGQPVQQYDLQNLSPAAQTTRLDTLFEDFGQYPFDFAHGPLWRVGLVTLSSTQHHLLMSLPALCADAATLACLLHEIGFAYAASLSDKTLTTEPLQYADLAEWQNELLESGETAVGRNYWHKQTWPDPAALKLPFETHPVASAPFNPQMIPLNLTLELTAQIDTIAQQYAVTPGALWQSCWHILLGRYSRQAELLTGLVTDGRTHTELKSIPGLFARTLPFADYIEETRPFSTFLRQVNQTAAELYEWQDYFSPELIDTPAFSFEFTPQPTPMVVEGVIFTLTRQFVCTDRFKAKLAARPGAADLYYDADIFQATDMKRLAGQLGELVASAIAQPEAPISKLNLLTPAERQQLLVEFNQTQAELPATGCVHHLFEAQVERVPEQMAVMFEGQGLSYSELNRRANQLAHHLQTLGVGPETLVAIFVERSLEMVIGMLGILKAGGAYIPLDPMLPTERLAFLLEDTQTPVLLTQQHLLTRLPDNPPHLVCLDADWAMIAQQPEKNTSSTGQADNLVYVLFTSGSTGQPKGVMVEHRQLLNYIHSITTRLDLPAGANYATVSTFAADLGNTVIFPALCSGSCLHIITHERATNPDALADYFYRYQLDCLKLVPSHLAALFASTEPKKIMPRQCLILGGETSHWDLVKKAQALAPQCRIFNHYGPTETTVGVLTYHISEALSTPPSYPTPGTVPLGRPIANTQIYILDSHRQPMPIWMPGEVYIGGAAVARGYLNRPELTAERFIKAETDQFIPSPSSLRLYRTGDLARYLPDGTIEFLGRVDNQVKIRGFRIELGEIEALLGQHPAVRETVVVVREDQPDNKQLAAYIVPAPNYAPTNSELRTFLKEKLPDPMLPATFVLLDKLPLTSNGKINRRALPVPDAAHLAFEETYLAPRNTTEEALAQLWANILGLERVGVRDNFFDLGGHSLLAVRLMAQVQRWFGRDIPLATLFQAGTIEHLAAILSRQDDTLSQSPLVKIQPNGSKLPFFCIHPADGSVLSYVALARALGEDQPFYGLQTTYLNQSESLKTMAADYIRVIRAVQPQGPYLLGGWSMGGLVAFEMAQQLYGQSQPVALLALLDSWTPDSDPRYPAGHQPDPASQPSPDELDTQLLLDFLRHLRGRYAKDLPVLSDDFRQLNLDKKLHYIIEHAKILELVFPEGELSQLHRLLQIFKFNVQAVSNYTPQVYPGRITLFQASEWFAAAQHPQGHMPDSALGWQKLSREPLEIQPIPGDHYTIVAEPNLRVLAERLKTCLNKVQQMEFVAK